mgnify:CR=1 FL=1
MTKEIQTYEQAILREIKNKEILDELEKKSDIEYQDYLNECTKKINKFLEQKGSDARYDVAYGEGYDYFATRYLEKGSKMQEEFFDFVDNKLPRYVETVKIPEELRYCSIWDFGNLPLNLKREDFSSDKYYNVYKGHAHCILSDRD